LRRLCPCWQRRLHLCRCLLGGRRCASRLLWWSRQRRRLDDNGPQRRADELNSGLFRACRRGGRSVGDLPACLGARRVRIGRGGRGRVGRWCAVRGRAWSRLGGGGLRGRCSGGSRRHRRGRRCIPLGRIIGQDQHLQAIASGTYFEGDLGASWQRHVAGHPNRPLVGGDGGEAVTLAPQHDAFDNGAWVQQADRAGRIRYRPQHRTGRHRTGRSDEAAAQRVEEVAHTRLMDDRPAAI
jgi:hypothetical protein